MTYTITIRNKRQLTLPRELLNQLALSIGDQLSVKADNKKMVAKPVKNQALNSLNAIQNAFAKSGLSEKDLQEGGKNLRKRLVKEIYG